MRSSVGRRLVVALKILVLLSCVTVVLMSLWFFCRVPSLLDPQGEVSSVCKRLRLSPSSNGKGLIVTGYYSVCDDISHDSAVYVHLHTVAERETRDTLIFRYFDYPLANPPQFRWLSPSSLVISVGAVEMITKMVTSHSGAHIGYSIRQELHPRDTSNSVMGLVPYVIGLLLLDIALFFLGKSIVRSLRRPQKSVLHQYREN